MKLQVVAAIIVNERGAVLCVKRGASKYASTAYKWEFPGGKQEPNETAEQCAVREVAEELNLKVEAVGLGPCVTHTYPEFSITLQAILCRLCEDVDALTLREHLEASWTLPDALWRHDFAEADQPITLWLRERYFGSQLRTTCFGRVCTFVSACTSTNDLCLQRAEAGAPEGTLVVGEVQSAGRGRLGREWLSEPGQGLLFSFLARPVLPPEMMVTLPLVAGIAMSLALRETGVDAGLKWPNDVLIGERKVCGILCEAHTSARGIEGIVIGVGVNVGAVPEAVAYRAVGLEHRLDRMNLLAKFLQHFEALYARWSKQGLAGLRDELDMLDAKKDKPIRVRLSKEPTEGIARGIREDGALLLEHPNGQIEALFCGEIAQWD